MVVQEEGCVRKRRETTHKNREVHSPCLGHKNKYRQTLSPLRAFTCVSFFRHQWAFFNVISQGSVLNGAAGRSQNSSHFFFLFVLDTATKLK